MFGKLKALKDEEERLAYLIKKSPYVYASVLRGMNKTKELEIYKENCKQSTEEYSAFVICFLKPYLDYLKQQDSLKEGMWNKKILI